MDIELLNGACQAVCRCGTNELVSGIGKKAIENGLGLEARLLDNGTIEINFEGTEPVESVGLSFGGELFDAGTNVFTVDGLGVLGEAFKRPQYGSFMRMVKLHGQDEWLLLGVGDRGADISCFNYEDGRLFAGWRPRRAVGGQFCRRMLAWTGPEPKELLGRYSSFCQSLYPECAELPKEIPVGWNSWDYYSAAISMGAIEREMAAINASPLGGKLKFFTLDMGWENAWGDWRPNGRFPHELDRIAGSIKEHGFMPGLWVSPMQVEYSTELARFRQELLVKGRDGNPLLAEAPVGCVALLDFFNDTACEMVSSWFRKYYEAGFRFFKVDYIYSIYLDRLGECPYSLGAGEYVRRCFRAIRSALGPDARVLNCGAPAEAAAGFAEIARTGNDIHTFWCHVRKCTRMIVAKHWQNGMLWTNDPDFAIFRTLDNTADDIPLNHPYQHTPYEGDDGWMAGPETNAVELKTWLSIVRLCGGSVCFSDSIAAMKQEGIETLARMLPPLESPAEPLGMFDEVLPRFWRGDRVLGVFNWEDEPAVVGLECFEWLPAVLRDFWTGESVSRQEGLSLAPHQGTLLVW